MKMWLITHAHTSDHKIMSHENVVDNVMITKMNKEVNGKIK